MPIAREAIAKHYSHPRLPAIDPASVILTAGTSGALYTAITSLCEKGTNLLMPQPGFPLCGTICENLGVSVKRYRLLPEKEWQVDLKHLESLVDENTAAILVNNPANPCGSVFSEEHMLEILALAERVKLPIIADEVYYGMAYDKSIKFIPFAHVGADQKEDAPKVPIISVCALSKIYCIPGWRLGWVIFHDQHGYFKNTIEGALRVSQIWLHPQVPLQAALPNILGKVPESYMEDFLSKLSTAADYVYSEIREKLGEYLIPVRTRGAMYMMLQIRLDKLDSSISSDVDFAQYLVNEQGVLMLPGKCFSAPSFVRVVLCHNTDFFATMIERLQLFCEAHSV